MFLDLEGMHKIVISFLQRVYFVIANVCKRIEYRQNTEFADTF